MTDIPCAVLLGDERDSIFSTAEVARVTAPLLGQTEIDARLAVRRSAGFAARNLDQESARTLAQALRDAGFMAHILPEAEVIEVPRFTRLSHLYLDSQGLIPQVSLRRLPLVPWEEVTMIHAYAFAHELDSKELELRRKRRKRGVSVASISEVSEHCRNMLWNISSYEDRVSGFRISLNIDLAIDDPDYLFRISHDAFSFDGLETPRAHSVDSYLALLSSLTDRWRKTHKDQALPMRTDLILRPSADLDLYLIEREEERGFASSWLYQRQGWSELWRRSESPASEAASASLETNARAEIESQDASDTVSAESSEAQVAEAGNGQGEADSKDEGLAIDR